MDEGLISQRYAKALFRYARDLKADDIVYDKMKLFLENFQSHPHLQKAMLNPVLSPRDKELLLSTAIGIEPEEAYMRFIRLLIKNHREGYMKRIALLYEDIYRKAHGILLVNIVTATVLSESAIRKIKETIARHTKQKLEFSTSVDAEIIGGFVLRMGTEQLDASARKELKEIKKELLNG